MNLTEQSKEDITDDVIESRDVEEELTADEMFEKLGYEKIDKKGLKHIQYVRQINKNTKENITFHKTFKKVEVYFYDYEDYEELTKPIAMQELKAINKKAKELGWLDE